MVINIKKTTCICILKISFCRFWWQKPIFTMFFPPMAKTYQPWFQHFDIKCMMFKNDFKCIAMSIYLSIYIYKKLGICMHAQTNKTSIIMMMILSIFILQNHLSCMHTKDCSTNCFACVIQNNKHKFIEICQVFSL